MKILVTGSAGHLGEALMRTLASRHDLLGVDIKPSAHTQAVGSIADRAFVHECLRGVEAVLHTATLHKPHVATHTRQDFIDTNVSGTLNLLEEAVLAGVKALVFTSTTSTYGHALNPVGAAPAVWVDEDLVPVPKNIYGVTKIAAESLCELVHRRDQLPCLILRTSRFFPEADDHAGIRETYDDTNTKANEYLYRRVEVDDVVSAHVCALDKAAALGFGRYVISATTPFTKQDLAALRTHAPEVVHRHVPAYAEEYARRGWKMFQDIGRVYDNSRARRELGWQPRTDFAALIERLRRGEDARSELARSIGLKGYHEEIFENGPFPVE
jgi:UDP-glucose 4-epimerase